MRAFFSTFFSLLFISLSSVALSQDQDKKEPIYIHGDNGIEIDRLRKEIRAFKKAYVKRGSSTVYGDVLYGYYTEDLKGKMSLTKVDAIGNVKVIMPDKALKAREGTYNVIQDVVIFRGDVQVAEKQNYLKGSYAVMDRKTGRTQVFNYDPLSSSKTISKPGLQNQVRVLLGGKKSLK